MAVRPRYIKLEEGAKTGLGNQSPVVTLLYLSGQGIVFSSRRHFDTGTKLAIGLHLDKVREDLALSKSAFLFDLNSFLDVQGFVADCKVMEIEPGGVSYQVTLLFDGLGEADEILVEALEREAKMRNQPSVTAARQHRVGLN